MNPSTRQLTTSNQDAEENNTNRAMFRSQPKPSSTTLPDVSTKEQVQQLVSGASNSGYFSSVAVAEHVDSAAQSLGLDSGTRSAARTLLNSTRKLESGASAVQQLPTSSLGEICSRNRGTFMVALTPNLQYEYS